MSRPELPVSFKEAQQYYRNNLLTDESWFQNYRGRYIAIVGHEIVAEGRDFEEVFKEVYPRFQPPVFIHKVGEEKVILSARQTFDYYRGRLFNN